MSLVFTRSFFDHIVVSIGAQFPSQDQFIKFSRMELEHLLRVAIKLGLVIILVFVSLVYESYDEALKQQFKEEQLAHFKEEETLLLLHLAKIELKSIQCHENFQRLAEIGTGGGKSEDTGSNEDKQGTVSEVDFDLIHKQTEQLYHMEQELIQEIERLTKITNGYLKQEH